LEDADARTRFLRANELVNETQDELTELLRIRREAAIELVDSGHSQTELGRWSGMSRARIGQLLASGPQPERILLGAGSNVTVAIGGKAEANSAAAASTNAMISNEAAKAYDLIADLCSTYGLRTQRETVPPPGLVRLNRPNLIVIGSPKVLPIVGQVIEADPNYGFEQSGSGWHLVDHQDGLTFKSPAEKGESCDYAYLGRLPRPDGKGNFLYLAGIHAMGTHVAAQYLVDNIDSLYTTVKNRNWSLLIEGCYDQDSREITSTKPLRDVRTF